jgi:hypothetical protein
MVVFFGDKDKKLSTLPYFHHVSSCNFLRKVKDTKKSSIPYLMINPKVIVFFMGTYSRVVGLQLMICGLFVSAF